MTTAACTIISRNYLPYARVLGRSLRQHAPDCEFYVLMVDGPENEDQRESFQVINVGDLGIENFSQVAFRYNVLELNTNVKPTFLLNLMNQHGVEKLLYFDPDISVYSSLEAIFSRLDRCSILLTPHCVTPIQDDRRPSEIDFLLAGVFNLGFIGLRKCEETNEFLRWWENRCLQLGFSEVRSGLFVDQKWINLAPCYFDSVCVTRDLGCNVAYWNLHERTIGKENDEYFVNGASRLCFFHFSGIDPRDPEQLSKHSNRHRLADRPDLIPLFSDYRQRVIEMGYNDYQGRPYSFGVYSDGEPVTQIARSAFAISEKHFDNDNPFDTGSNFYRWADSRGLLGSEDTSSKYNNTVYKSTDSRVRAANRFLWALLKILGPNRYTILMKYLSFISILRNQAGVLSPE